MKNIAIGGMGLVLLLGLAGLASAQNQTSSNTQSSSGQSLGDYARQIRREPEAPKAKPKVFDNDNLPREDKLSVVGKPADQNANTAPAEEPATPQAGSEAKPATAADATGAKAPEGEQKDKEAAWKQWGDKLASQQSQIDLLTRELDVATKEYQLKAAAMYGDAGNRLRNSADWDKQDTQYKQQIADKQKALDEAKHRLEDLQEEARKAGVPSSVREP